MRKGCDGREKNRGKSGGNKKKRDVVASRLPACQPTGLPTASAKSILCAGAGVLCPPILGHFDIWFPKNSTIRNNPGLAYNIIPLKFSGNPPT